MHTIQPGKTIREAYMEASSFLQSHANHQEPRQVTEWLLLHVLQWTRSDLFLRWDEVFPEHKREEWQELIKRKATGEPVQYIVGEQEFYGLTFIVNESVLIPRPETEILVEHVLLEGRNLLLEHSVFAVDIGTGSGVIPVSIAMNEPSWRIAASDISPTALNTAKQNAVKHGVEQRIEFVQGDLLHPFIEQQARIDILISNPPYIPSTDIETLDLEVRQYEPRLALDGGEDGLAPYRKLIQQCAKLPHYPRVIGLEVGIGQAAQVARMLAGCQAWNRIEVIPDLAGIPRHVIGSESFRTS